MNNSGGDPTAKSTTPWEIRQSFGCTRIEDLNRAFRLWAEQGFTTPVVAPDLPTQMGMEADSDLTVGEVAKVGVHLSTARDLADLMDGLDPARIHPSFGGAPTAPIVYAQYLSWARGTGAGNEELRAVFAGDVLNEYVAYGTFVIPPRAALRLAADFAAYAIRETPGVTPLVVSGYHAREAGCDAAQEIAIALSFAAEYIAAIAAAGAPSSQVLPRLAFLFDATTSLRAETAKLLAARRLAAQIFSERFGVAEPVIRLRVKGSGAAMSAGQTELNLVRTTLQALAAIGAGAESISLPTFDTTQGLPGDLAAQVAIRTQLVLALESDTAAFSDAFCADEAEAIAQQAKTVFDKIQGWGGALAAIESGRLQALVSDAADAAYRNFETGTRRAVGVTDYEDEPAPSALASLARAPVPNGLRDEHIQRTARVKVERDGAALQSALTALERAAREKGASVMTPLILAVGHGATTGEIVEVLRRVFGPYGAEMAGI